MLLWEVVTDGAEIVETRDRRTYATASRVLTLSGDLPASPGLVDRRTVVDDRLFIERVVVDVPGLGGATSGETRAVERGRGTVRDGRACGLGASLGRGSDLRVALIVVVTFGRRLIDAALQLR